MAQIIAYFATRAGGRIAVLKAIKLAYLADRQHMKDHAHPLFHDNIVSMRHGPAHSITYDFIAGIMEREAGWSEFLRDRNGRSIAARKRFTRGDLDEISDSEMDTLKATWREFGRMDEWKICGWVNRNCPEWENPGASSMPLPHERIFKYLGYSDATILAGEIEEERRIDEFWDSLAKGRFDLPPSMEERAPSP